MKKGGWHDHGQPSQESQQHIKEIDYEESEAHKGTLTAEQKKQIAKLINPESVSCIEKACHVYLTHVKQFENKPCQRKINESLVELHELAKKMSFILEEEWVRNQLSLLLLDTYDHIDLNHPNTDLDPKKLGLDLLRIEKATEQVESPSGKKGNVRDGGKKFHVRHFVFRLCTCCINHDHQPTGGERGTLQKLVTIIGPSIGENGAKPFSSYITEVIRYFRNQ